MPMNEVCDFPQDYVPTDDANDVEVVESHFRNCPVCQEEIRLVE